MSSLGIPAGFTSAQGTLCCGDSFDHHLRASHLTSSTPRTTPRSPTVIPSNTAPVACPPRKVCLLFGSASASTHRSPSHPTGSDRCSRISPPASKTFSRASRIRMLPMRPPRTAAVLSAFLLPQIYCPLTAHSATESPFEPNEQGRSEYRPSFLRQRTIPPAVGAKPSASLASCLLNSTCPRRFHAPPAAPRLHSPNST